MPNQGDDQNLANHQIATIEATLGTADLGQVEQIQEVGSVIEYDRPQAGKAIGGVIRHVPKLCTLKRRLTSCTAWVEICNSREVMATPRDFTFRLVRGANGKVARSVSATQCHVAAYWIESERDSNGHFQLWECITFQPEGMSFG